MKFYINRTLIIISIGAISIGTSSCAQDSMIRINSTSNLNLPPNTEIRYKSCGEVTNGCQEILKSISQNISSKQSESNRIATAKIQARTRVAIQEAEQVREQKVQECILVESRKSNIPGTTTTTSQNFTGVVTVRTDYTVGYNRREDCKRSTPLQVSSIASSSNSTDENSFNLEQETKKVIKATSDAELNEYTFSKSDGSIVVICPTRYCAIASGDGGWIGIGEKGKSIEMTSVVR